jgi:hypothetical protein
MILPLYVTVFITLQYGDLYGTTIIKYTDLPVFLIFLNL